MPYYINVYRSSFQVRLGNAKSSKKQCITTRVSLHRKQLQCKHILSHSLTAMSAWPRKACLEISDCCWPSASSTKKQDVLGLRITQSLVAHHESQAQQIIFLVIALAANRDLDAALPQDLCKCYQVLRMLMAAPVWPVSVLKQRLPGMSHNLMSPSAHPAACKHLHLSHRLLSLQAG